MKISDYHFMQISGNCAAVWYLGADRLKGPVDNCVTKGPVCLKSLFNNTYYDKIIHGKYITWPREPSHQGDCTTAYSFEHVLIVHSDPTTIKYQEELLKRVNLFNDFLIQVKTNPLYYFTYTINDFDIDRKKHILTGSVLEDDIKILKEEGVLDKTIFVSCTNTESWWDFWAPGIDKLVEKYNLHYINIDKMFSWDNGKSHQQFLQKAEKCIQEWKN